MPPLPPALKRPKAAPKAKGKRVNRRPRSNLTVGRVLKALAASSGIRAHAADALKVHKGTITRFIQAHPKMLAAEESIIEGLVDEGEAMLLKMWRAENFPALKYFLDTKGRARGYGVKHVELTGRDGGPIELKDMSGFSDEQLAILERAALVLAGGDGGDGEQTGPLPPEHQG